MEALAGPQLADGESELVARVADAALVEMLPMLDVLLDPGSLEDLVPLLDPDVGVLLEDVHLGQQIGEIGGGQVVRPHPVCLVDPDQLVVHVGESRNVPLGFRQRLLDHAEAYLHSGSLLSEPHFVQVAPSSGDVNGGLAVHYQQDEVELSSLEPLLQESLDDLLQQGGTSVAGVQLHERHGAAPARAQLGVGRDDLGLHLPGLGVAGAHVGDLASRRASAIRGDCYAHPEIVDGSLDECVAGVFDRTGPHVELHVLHARLLESVGHLLVPLAHALRVAWGSEYHVEFLVQLLPNRLCHGVEIPFGTVVLGHEAENLAKGESGMEEILPETLCIREGLARVGDSLPLLSHTEWFLSEGHTVVGVNVDPQVGWVLILGPFLDLVVGTLTDLGLGADVGGQGARHVSGGFWLAA